MTKVVVLLSGGMDSSTLLYEQIARLGVESVFPLSFNYGSKHNQRENYAAAKIVEIAKIPSTNHKIVSIPDLGKLGGSVLTDPFREVPSQDEKKQTDTVVPGRNTILLGFGIAYAEVVGATEVLFGACLDDFESYPDCRTGFVEAMATVARLGSDRKVLSVEAPYLFISKIDIVKIGLELKVPYSKTWTCYKGEELSCGICDSCKERLEAFRANGVEDPIKYQSK